MMTGIRTVIVDDSSFSIAFIRGILEQHGFEVVGEAGTLEEVKEVISATRPQLVTMDMTLPGTDGLECTRAIHSIDKDIKVIVISSMMDEEIVKQAKENKVSGYIQKPVDEDELITAISRIMASDELYLTLKEECFTVFKESLMDGMNKMTKTHLTYNKEYLFDEEQGSKGLTIIVGIIGKFSGRMLIDLSVETATRLATAILRKEPKDKNEMIAILGEFTNIISGNACSVLNKKNKAYGLRVAPPTSLHGENVRISAPRYNTTIAVAETVYGQILLNAGFQRGEDSWM